MVLVLGVDLVRELLRCLLGLVLVPLAFQKLDELILANVHEGSLQITTIGMSRLVRRSDLLPRQVAEICRK